MASRPSKRRAGAPQSRNPRANPLCFEAVSAGLSRTVAAFRSRPSEPAEPEDVVRVWAHGGARVALLANGFECGFSACWPPASRRVLDLFREEWLACGGDAAERLGAAFERARRRFVRDARSLLAAEPDFPDDVPTAVLLGVAVAGDCAHAAWIGGDVAVLARAGRVVAATTPHTLRERYLREGGAPEAVEQLPNVLSRHIGSADVEPPSTLSLQLEARDTLVLLSRAVFHGPCVAPERVALEAERERDPGTLAQ